VKNQTQVYHCGNYRITIEHLDQPIEPSVFDKHLTAIVNEYGIPATEILSPSRTESIATARQALYASLYHAGFSTREIGRFVNRDRGAVAHGIHAHNNRIVTRPPTRSTLYSDTLVTYPRKTGKAN